MPLCSSRFKRFDSTNFSQVLHVLSVMARINYYAILALSRSKIHVLKYFARLHAIELLSHIYEPLGKSAFRSPTKAPPRHRVCTSAWPPFCPTVPSWLLLVFAHAQAQPIIGISRTILMDVRTATGFIQGHVQDSYMLLAPPKHSKALFFWMIPPPPEAQHNKDIFQQEINLNEGCW